MSGVGGGDGGSWYLSRGRNTDVSTAKSGKFQALDRVGPTAGSLISGADPSAGPLAYLNIYERCRLQKVSRAFWDEVRLAPLWPRVDILKQPGGAHMRVNEFIAWLFGNTYEHPNQHDRWLEQYSYPLLKSLDFGGCYPLTDKSMKAVAAGCASLLSLNLDDCRNITDESLKAIAAGCPSLTSLNVANCNELTYKSMDAIAVGCTSLTALDVRNCSKFTDRSLMAVAAGCASLAKLRVWKCGNITDRSLKAVAAGCTSLTALDIIQDRVLGYFRYYLSAESIVAIAGGCPSLTSLNVRGFKYLTDRSLKAVAAGCTSLTALDIQYCEEITDVSMKAVAAGCPFLTSLNARGCSKLTYEMTEAITKGRHPFKLNGLTSERIEAFAQDCASLR
jgi:hypothetical protein